MSSRRIEDLDPSFQALARRFLDECNKVTKDMTTPAATFITDGYRSYAEQDQLYAQGRTKPGNIVTNARGGDSWHNHGLAIDCAFKMVNGVLSYDSKYYNKIAPIAEELGIDWGGLWTSFPDKPHFEWHPGVTISQAKQGKRPIPWTETGTIEPDMTDDQKRALDVLEKFKTSAGHGNLEGAVSSAIGAYRDLPKVSERAATLAGLVDGLNNDLLGEKSKVETFGKQQGELAELLDSPNDFPTIKAEVKKLIDVEDQHNASQENPFGILANLIAKLFRKG